jgi:hypothetical protein
MTRSAEEREIKRHEIVLNVLKIKFIKDYLAEYMVDDFDMDKAFYLISEMRKYEWQMYRYIINNKIEFEGGQIESIQQLVIDREWDKLLDSLYFLGFEQVVVTDPKDPVQIDLAIHL